MFYISIFLSCLLLSDAFILPFHRDVTPPTIPTEFYEALTKFMTFVMPLKTVTLAFRSINKMIVLNAFMQKMSFLESLASMLIKRMDGKGASMMSTMMSKMMGMPHDTCLKRLICEVSLKNRRRSKRDLTKMMQVQKPQGNAAQQRIMITLKLPGPNFSSLSSMPSMPSIPSMSSMPQMPSMPSMYTNSSSFAYSSSSLENPCERIYDSCPYSTGDMFDALKKYFSVWREIRLPRHVKVPYFEILEPLDIHEVSTFDF